MNRVVLITGASRGLGAAIAKTFLDNGDSVFINYNKSEKEATKLASKYDNAFLIKCDITKEEEIREMFQTIKTKFNHLDVLVNNAAICCDNEYSLKTKEEFNQVLTTNLIAPFLICKHVKELMSDGSIINISSTNGIDTNETYSMDYDASKAGLISLTHNFAKAFAPHIRVNAIASGWINTPPVLEMNPKYIAEEKNKSLLNRFAEPEEIAQVVLFLASPAASYINNSVLRVDGGKK